MHFLATYPEFSFGTSQTRLCRLQQASTSYIYRLKSIRVGAGPGGAQRRERTPLDPAVTGNLPHQPVRPSVRAPHRNARDGLAVDSATRCYRFQETVQYSVRNHIVRVR
jgi:hypothetical protein